VKSALALFGFFAATFAAAGTGALFSPGAWYEALNKPSWTPPNIVFPLVWTSLYILMALAAWNVWRRGGWRARALPLALFLIQLVFNAAWSWLFFGQHRIDLALLDLIVLWVLVAATAIAFWKASALSGALLVPYLAWASFAGALNYSIWRLNS